MSDELSAYSAFYVLFNMKTVIGESKMFRIILILSAFALTVSAYAQSYTLNHPCLLHSQDDFEFVKSHVGEEPFASALKKLKNSQYCRTSHVPSPVEYLARLDATNWSQLNWRWENAGIADLWYEGIHNNYTNFMRDAAAAYQLALLYRIEGSEAAARASKNIIVQWSSVNKGLLRNKDGEIVDPNEKLIMFQPYQMAVAAEMLRDYNGWGNTDEFRKVVKWFDDAFYGESHAHLELQNSTGGGHYWLNWDLAAMTTIFAIGVLSDNQAYIEEAISYYKGSGGGPGNIYKGVPYLHVDADSDELLGQGNELGRDQGHNVLCAAVMGTFCRMALVLGEDLFAFDNYRALAFAEYTAKYNLAKEQLYPDAMQSLASMRVGENDEDFEYPHASFPFTTYVYGDGGTMTEPSQASRGNVRPCWDFWVGYANSHGLSAVYCSKMAECIRPDGGGGHYGGNSGGFDQIGFSTLTAYRPFVENEIPDDMRFVCVADTWVRQDSPKVSNGQSEKIELRALDIKDEAGEVVGHNLLVGLFGFIYNIPEGKKVESATFHFVTERVKGNAVSLYGYDHDFMESDATWNTESAFIESSFSGEPIAVFNAAGQKGKAIFDGGITSDRCNVSAWTNEIDVTQYVASLGKDVGRVNFLLSEIGDQVCFYSKDNKGQDGAFKNSDAMTNLPASMLMPYLSIHLVDTQFDDKDEAENPDDDGQMLAPEIETIGGEAEYYNLQGLRVAHPVEGSVYIVRRGNIVVNAIL